MKNLKYVFGKLASISKEVFFGVDSEGNNICHFYTTLPELKKVDFDSDISLRITYDYKPNGIDLASNECYITFWKFN